MATLTQASAVMARARTQAWKASRQASAASASAMVRSVELSSGRAGV